MWINNKQIFKLNDVACKMKILTFFCVVSFMLEEKLVKIATMTNQNGHTSKMFICILEAINLVLKVLHTISAYTWLCENLLKTLLRVCVSIRCFLSLGN